MNQALLTQQLAWWMSHEPQLFEKLADSLRVRFDPLPELSILLVECLKFLYLAGNVKNNEKFTPSIMVDETWHCLILFTASYQQFCQQFYGEFIHHHPGGDEAVNHKQLQFTLYALQAQFGKLDSTIWPTDVVLDITGSCSTCES
jgi:hypothetical protein